MVAITVTQCFSVAQWPHVARSHTGSVLAIACFVIFVARENGIPQWDKWRSNGIFLGYTRSFAQTWPAAKNPFTQRVEQKFIEQNGGFSSACLSTGGSFSWSFIIPKMATEGFQDMNKTWSIGEMSMSNERADMSMFFEIVASQMCSAIVCYSIRLSMVNAHQLGIQTSCTFAYRLAKRFSGC